MSTCTEFFTVQFSFQGKTLEGQATVLTTADELLETARSLLFPNSSSDGQPHAIKLLFKGKRLEGSSIVFPTAPSKIPKMIVLATTTNTVTELNSRRSDPTIRGFDNERSIQSSKTTPMANGYWGPLTRQHKDYKFCRFQACTWQSFGHRPVDETPHDFAALNLLEQLATDPGMVAILQERELVVTMLGEMDPIDDRLMQKTQQQKGMCLLGYNTNAGARIDLKLRTDDLKGFRPYSELAATLIHELSHNWVSDHNLLFWTNYGQMRVEYLSRHIFGTGGIVVRGQTTAQLAGLPSSLKAMSDIYAFVMGDLTREMAMHGLDARTVAAAIRARCDEWEQTAVLGQTLGNDVGSTARPPTSSTENPRDLARRAAERRRQDTGEPKKE
jgi:WLM domain